MEGEKKKDASRPMELTVKAVLLNGKNQVLVLRRAEGARFNAGLWDLPGGLVEKGETLEETLLREIEEETGLKAKVGALIKASEFSKEHEAFVSEKRGLRFLARTIPEDSEVILHKKEHQEYRWLELAEAADFFSEEGYEKEKKETILAALDWLEKEAANQNWQRALADLENFKKRAQKSNQEFRTYCLEDLFLEIIPVLDNFDAAWEHLDEEKKKDNIFLGFFHIKNQLQKILEDRGLVEMKIDSGEKFNENQHEALVAEKEGKSQGKIKKVLKKGYLLAGKVIRPAGVEVE